MLSSANLVPIKIIDSDDVIARIISTVVLIKDPQNALKIKNNMMHVKCMLDRKKDYFTKLYKQDLTPIETLSIYKDIAENSLLIFNRIKENLTILTEEAGSELKPIKEFMKQLLLNAEHEIIKFLVLSLKHTTIIIKNISTNQSDVNYNKIIGQIISQATDLNIAINDAQITNSQFVNYCRCYISLIEFLTKSNPLRLTAEDLRNIFINLNNYFCIIKDYLNNSEVDLTEKTLLTQSIMHIVSMFVEILNLDCHLQIIEFKQLMFFYEIINLIQKTSEECFGIREECFEIGKKISIFILNIAGKLLLETVNHNNLANENWYVVKLKEAVEFYNHDPELSLIMARAYNYDLGMQKRNYSISFSLYKEILNNIEAIQGLEKNKILASVCNDLGWIHKNGFATGVSDLQLAKEFFIQSIKFGNYYSNHAVINLAYILVEQQGLVDAVNFLRHKLSEFIAENKQDENVIRDMIVIYSYHMGVIYYYGNDYDNALDFLSPLSFFLAEIYCGIINFMKNNTQDKKTEELLQKILKNTDEKVTLSKKHIVNDFLAIQKFLLLCLERKYAPAAQKILDDISLIFNESPGTICVEKLKNSLNQAKQHIDIADQCLQKYKQLESFVQNKYYNLELEFVEKLVLDLKTTFKQFNTKNKDLLKLQHLTTIKEIHKTEEIEKIEEKNDVAIVVLEQKRPEDLPAAALAIKQSYSHPSTILFSSKKDQSNQLLQDIIKLHDIIDNMHLSYAYKTLRIINFLNEISTSLINVTKKNLLLTKIIGFINKCLIFVSTDFNFNKDNQLKWMQNNIKIIKSLCANILQLFSNNINNLTVLSVCSLIKHLCFLRINSKLHNDTLNNLFKILKIKIADSGFILSQQDLQYFLSFLTTISGKININNLDPLVIETIFLLNDLLAAQIDSQVVYFHESQKICLLFNWARLHYCYNKLIEKTEIIKSLIKDLIGFVNNIISQNSVSCDETITLSQWYMALKYFSTSRTLKDIIDTTDLEQINLTLNKLRNFFQDNLIVNVNTSSYQRSIVEDIKNICQQLNSNKVRFFKPFKEEMMVGIHPVDLLLVDSQNINNKAVLQIDGMPHVIFIVDDDDTISPNDQVVPKYLFRNKLHSLEEGICKVLVVACKDTEKLITRVAKSEYFTKLLTSDNNNHKDRKEDRKELQKLTKSVKNLQI